MNSPYSDEKGNIINYYEIFNIPVDAVKEDIRSAFCNLVKIYHPDISHKNTEIERKKIDLIIKGYKILIDDTLRNDYNRYLFEFNKINEDIKKDKKSSDYIYWLISLKNGFCNIKAEINWCKESINLLKNYKNKLFKKGQ